MIATLVNMFALLIKMIGSNRKGGSVANPFSWLKLGHPYEVIDGTQAREQIGEVFTGMASPTQAHGRRAG